MKTRIASGRRTVFKLLKYPCIMFCLMFGCAGVAAAAEEGQREPSGVAISSFLAVIALTLCITCWAAKRTRTAHQFYAAGSSIRGWQNGFAIAGDFMSAATFLGLTGLFFTIGFDSIIYILCPPVAYAIIAFLLADRLRNLGKFTFADIICGRLERKTMRIYASIAALVSALVYLIAQMVGAGALIQILFGIPYNYAISLVGILMVLYVAFGGMLATTWVQITKAVILMFGVIYMAFMVLHAFDFNYAALYQQAMANHENGVLLTMPGGLNIGFFNMLSMSAGLLFGIIASPHILMRFFTVPDARNARQSSFVALLIVSFVFLLIFYVIAAGSVAMVKGDPRFLDPSGNIIGGTNMVAIHLGEVLGGEVFLGIISAVAFATILAVVAGLTLASASAISHDLYANVFRLGSEGKSKEVLVSKLTTVMIGIATIILGVAFQGQNIAYLVALALAIAASANFPVLILSIFWRGLTTRGAWIGGTMGLISALLFVIFGPAVWVEVFGFERPVFPSGYPALYAMLIAFFFIWVLSRTDKSERAGVDYDNFNGQEIRSQFGGEDL
jgi:cation/acetate symporter